VVSGCAHAGVNVRHIPDPGFPLLVGCPTFGAHPHVLDDVLATHLCLARSSLASRAFSISASLEAPAPPPGLAPPNMVLCCTVDVVDPV
jgi:hypothetical protein